MKEKCKCEDIHEEHLCPFHEKETIKQVPENKKFKCTCCDVCTQICLKNSK